MTGPFLPEIAESLARSLGSKSFIATTSFLACWKVRHGIVQKTVAGEAGSVQDETMKPWVEVVLPELLKQRKPEGIYNVDNTSLFFKL